MDTTRRLVTTPEFANRGRPGAARVKIRQGAWMACFSPRKRSTRDTPDLSLHTPVAPLAVEPVSSFSQLLEDGLANGEFQLFFQPKVNARSKDVVGAECLIRWSRARALGLTIEDVIEKAEESGSILALTRWVVNEVAGIFDRIDQVDPTLTIAINISSALVGRPHFSRTLIREAGAFADRIVLEITETAIMTCPDHALRNMQELSAAGFVLSLDDFGTGYSSLSQLQVLPINELKIDRSFVTDIADSHRGPLIVRSTIELAHALDFEVVAEGIEDAETMALLTIMGCDQLQGYFIGKPMSEKHFMTWLKNADHAYQQAQKSPLIFGL